MLSLDSVITAVDMVDEIGIMLAFAGAISDFVQQHPTIKMLALSFLLRIGVTLRAEGFHQHMPKGYRYFSMAFSLLGEIWWRC